MEQGFSWERIWRAFGNGDSAKGRLTLEKLTERIEYAREEHGWGAKKEISSPYGALNALEGEIREWTNAIHKETKERQLDEALDILAVATRIANQEYNL